jgi:protein SCO1
VTDAGRRTDAPRASGSFPGRRGARRLCGAVAVAVLAWSVACVDLRPLHGTVYEPPRPAPELRLARGDGSTYDLAAERGRVVAVFFGYANCPDLCPTTLADLAKVANALDEGERARFRVLFVSVDPARDTPAVADAYARRFHPSFVGVTGAEARVLSIARSFGVAAMAMPAAPDSAGAHDAHAGHAAHPPAPSTVGYQVVHGGSLFLVDPEGRIRTVHPSGSPVADVLADVRKLAD